MVTLARSVPRRATRGHAPCGELVRVASARGAPRPAPDRAGGPPRHRRIIALLALALPAGCSGTRAEPVPQPPQPEPPKRETVRFTESGCIVGGVAHGPDEAFEHEGKLCGCHAGRLSCVDASEEQCFRDGQWYPEGTGTEIYDPWRHCGCYQAPKWRCAEQRTLMPDCPKVTPLWVIRFELDSSKLPANIDYLLHGVADQLVRNPGARVRLEAHAHPKEEKATQLAQRRAEGVRATLFKLGAKPHQVEIDNFGTSPAPAPDNLPPCSDVSALEPGPFVAIEPL